MAGAKTESIDRLVAEGGKILASDECAALQGNLCTAGTPRESVRAGQERRLMAAFSIRFDGRHFRYNGYRYDNVADAVAYAALTHCDVDTQVGPYPWSLEDEVGQPSLADEQLMIDLGISFASGRYAHDGFHYDRLCDAVEHARSS